VESLPLAKNSWQGPLILNESITLEQAKELVRVGTVDAVSFGRPFIGNPDLVSRFQRGGPLADFDPNTLYSPGPDGYIDYPAAEPDRA
jgi:N-ethylmaleimide reductase